MREPTESAEVLAIQEVRKLIHEERRSAERRHRRLRTGLAGAFSVILPGLGHLVLNLYGPAFTFMALYAASGGYFVYRSMDRYSESNWWWLLPLAIWLYAIYNAIERSDSGEID